MTEDISALVDGESTDAASGRCLDAISGDVRLAQAWDTYHLIGDSLRGEGGLALPASFRERLAAEPTVLAPQHVPVAAEVMKEAANSPYWLTALSAAAGVAAVAMAAWVALPGAEQAPLVAKAPDAATPAQPAAVPVAVGVDDYLLAHQRFSPSSNMQGVAPYVRTVSGERKGGN